MFLKEYLKKERITYREFAEKLDIQIPSLKNIIYGVRRPSLVLSLKIEDATDGKVTSRDLFNDYNKIQKKKANKETTRKQNLRKKS